MKRALFLCAVLYAISAQVAAFPDYEGLGPIATLTKVFTPVWNVGQAIVTSNVYDALDDEVGYIYTYQISGATTKFTWFSVAINPGEIITLWDFDLPGTAPAVWSPIDTPVNSIEAFFSTGLTAGNSALLWFTSPGAPGPGNGALAKLSYTGGTFATGEVLTPLPEPLTFVLFGAGGVMLCAYRKRS